VSFFGQVQENGGGQLTLTIRYPDTFTTPPVKISQGVTITNVEIFVAKTISELESHVATVNAGGNSTLGKFYLVDEKIRDLRLCGVVVEIEGARLTEPELKPLNVDPPNWDFKPKKPPEVKHLKIGLTDAEVRKLFSELGISPDDRTGLSESVLAWLKRCDEVQAHTRWMREVFSQMDEAERRQWLDEKVPTGVRLGERAILSGAFKR
jgi:hypothetical protein